MAKKKLKHDAQWKKGVSGNPAGNLDRDMRYRLRHLTQDELKKLLEYLFQADITQLERDAKDRTTPVLYAWFCRVAMEGIKNGSIHGLEAILTRILGKPRETVDFNASGMNAKVVITMPQNGREAHIVQDNDNSNADSEK